MARRVLPDLQDLRVLRVPLVLRVRLELSVLTAQQDLPGRQVLRDRPVRLVRHLR